VPSPRHAKQHSQSGIDIRGSRTLEGGGGAAGAGDGESARTEHPDTLSSINNLASTYRNQGRWNEAEELQVQVRETTKRVLC
jgi:Tetratricopeptide repeat